MQCGFRGLETTTLIDRDIDYFRSGPHRADYILDYQLLRCRNRHKNGTDNQTGIDDMEHDRIDSR